MTSFIWSFVEVNIMILLLFMGYLLLKKWLTYKQQRVVLLVLPLLAISAIILKFFFYRSGFVYAFELIKLNPVLAEVIGTGNLVGEKESIFSWEVMYAIGIAGFGLIFLTKLGKLWFFFRENSTTKQGDYYIYRIANKTSFSFFKHVQIESDLTGDDYEIVLEHEVIHANKRHSLDVVLIEVLHALFWLNPILFFIKRELKNTHEFEVDAIMFNKHKKNYMQFLVNYALGINTSHYLLTSRFYNKLTLKKRINSMKTNRKNNPVLLVVLPLVVVAFSLASWTFTNTIENTTENFVTEKVVEHLDKEPQFVGGSNAMAMFIGKHTQYPNVEKEKGIEGLVYIQFLVKKDGSLSDFEVKGSSKNENLDNEALRVVKLMPNWEPGEKGNKKVTTEMVLPILFKLN